MQVNIKTKTKEMFDATYIVVFIKPRPSRVAFTGVTNARGPHPPQPT